MNLLFALILRKKSWGCIRHGIFPLLAVWLGLVGFFDTSGRAQPYGLNSRPNVAPFLNGVLPPVSPVVSGNWSAVPAFPNLVFTNAVGLTFVPGTNLLCVWEREGRVWSFVNSSNVAQKKLVLDLSNQCQGWDDSGLLGLAFHPGFATNRFVFLYYTWVVPGTVVGDAYTRPPTFSAGAYHDRLVRYTLGTNGVALTNSETLLLDQTGDSAWHNGGGMFFHPTNGFLYWTDGDDADTANTQVITNKLLSGVFRIDVDRRGGSISHAPPRQPANGMATNYFIPNDNPFVGQSNVLEEFFCLGLRSPHRLTEDPGTGRIFIGDVGASAREEVDIIESGESGLNFQWSTIEGLNGDLVPPFPGVNRRPALDYPHTDGNFAVIGGYVYRGSQFAADLAGKYIFGDNGSDVVWVMDESTTPAGKVPLCTVPKGGGYNSGNDYTGLSSFGLDAAGEIYLCVMGNLGSPIYTLSRSGPTNLLNPPALFSQLGAFTNLATLAPSPALVPYVVNSPLWSDAAVKSRWIALPTNTAITFYPTGEWSFPVGTVFLKNFELVTNENFPALRRRLETRVLVCDTNGYVYGATYRWRTNNADADIVSFGTNENISITTATGVRTQTWYYPGRLDCLRCHTPASGGVLGAKARQLNGNFQYASGVTDNQLRTLNHLGFFSPTLIETNIASYTKTVSILDTNYSLELRARSYFDANCAHCHRPGGVSALFDMRFDTPLANQGLVNGFALNPLGVTGAKIISSGSTNKSVLFQRASSLGTIQMPPLAKNLVDTNAMSVLAAWINSLPPVLAPPPPWLVADLGSPLPGSASYNGGQFTLTASGQDFWDVADTGNFMFQPLVGDGQIIARVASQQFTSPWAKAGVMFRESLDAAAREVLVAVTPANGTTFQWRANPAAVTSYLPGPLATAPQWLKLIRAGNVFTGCVSPDGTNWTVAGSVTNVMGSNALCGLALTAQNPALFNLSTFDNVTLVFANGQPLYAVAGAVLGTATFSNQPVQFSAQGLGGRSENVFNTTDDHLGTVSAQGDNAAFGEVATNAFDNSTATKWLDFANANPATRASWIQYRYAGGAQNIVTQYSVAAANDAPERDPRDWRLLGSNDGTNWTTLDPRTGVVFTNRFELHSYAVANPNGFNIYRLQIDRVANPATANSVQLSELEFIGTPGLTCQWNFGDGAVSTAENPAHSYATNGSYTATLIVSDGTAYATNSVAFNVILAVPATAQWLANSAGLAAKKFHIAATGTDGASYIFEATTNFKSWTPLLTNSPAGGLLQFTDNVSTNFNFRFYRVRTP